MFSFNEHLALDVFIAHPHGFMDVMLLRRLIKLKSHQRYITKSLLIGLCSDGYLFAIRVNGRLFFHLRFSETIFNLKPDYGELLLTPTAKKFIQSKELTIL